ncbi:MAG: rod shape-determining protein RodA [Acidimicrobiales bacterium]
MTASVLSRVPRLRGQDGLWRYIDPSLIIASGAITALGTLMIFSATRNSPVLSPTYFVERQGAAIAIGIVVMGVVAAFDYRKLRELVPLAYFGLLGLLAGVLVFGQKVNDARAWFQFGSIQLQPAELAKPIMIVVLAAFFTGDRATEGHPPTVRRLLVALLLVGLPVGLIMRQPDLGTALVFGVISTAVVIMAGARPRHLLALALMLTFATTAVLTSNTLDAYQKDRLTVFINPDKASERVSYNLEQAQVAISNGGIAGQGLFRGSQTRGRFVPEQQTDFIFSVVGEELGFVGGALLIGLFCLLFLRMWRIAAVARDPFGAQIVVGVLAMLVFQVFQSIGMTMGIMPITGIPLPFVSYGGSSIITTYASIGLVLSVHMRRFS